MATTIGGIGETGILAKYETNFTINAHFQEKANIRVCALVLRSLTNILPSCQIARRKWDHISDLMLADPKFGQPGKIDMLLSAGIYAEILMDGFRRGPTGTPIAQKTKLGWILSGQTGQNTNHQDRHVLTMVSINCQDFDIKKFWEMEELPAALRRKTKEEEDCEEIFSKTHSRRKDGRFVVRLPFRPSFNKEIFLGRSRGRAQARLYQLEKKLKSDKNCREKYSQVLNEYLTLGHMERIGPLEDEATRGVTEGDGRQLITTNYLPHHAVIKESSSTTKLRIVFDASMKTTSGNSLNDCLMVGPRLQEDLFDINLRWRKYKIGMTADIEKMYRQIYVHPEEANFQRIVWRNNTSEIVNEYKLLTVTFGTASAAYLAVKSLQQCAIDEKEKRPHSHSAEVILRDFYVDDLLTGADSVDEACDIQNGIINILQSAGF